MEKTVAKPTRAYSAECLLALSSLLSVSPPPNMSLQQRTVYGVFCGIRCEDDYHEALCKYAIFTNADFLWRNRHKL